MSMADKSLAARYHSAYGYACHCSPAVAVLFSIPSLRFRFCSMRSPSQYEATADYRSGGYVPAAGYPVTQAAGIAYPGAQTSEVSGPVGATAATVTGYPYGHLYSYGYPNMKAYAPVQQTGPYAGGHAASGYARQGYAPINVLSRTAGTSAG